MYILLILILSLSPRGYSDINSDLRGNVLECRAAHNRKRVLFFQIQRNLCLRNNLWQCGLLGFTANVSDDDMRLHLITVFPCRL